MGKVIEEGALFIADAHYPHHGEAFFTLLQALESGQLTTPQLFLMGDNFDLLFGHNAYIQTFSQEAIVLLQRLSKQMPIYYFEGNHDFCLGSLFPDIEVFSREQQPQTFQFHEKKVALAHGDKFDTGWGYDLYCKVLRSRVTLMLLRPFQRYIIDDRMKKLAQKYICRSFVGFEEKVERIMKHYPEVNMVIEGHFHQAVKQGEYVSLPSLACQVEVGIAKEGAIAFVSLQDLVSS
jgi:UDP-2,3-diacylglucosamine hydrolase